MSHTVEIVRVKIYRYIQAWPDKSSAGGHRPPTAPDSPRWPPTKNSNIFFPKVKNNFFSVNQKSKHNLFIRFIIKKFIIFK